MTREVCIGAADKIVRRKGKFAPLYDGLEACNWVADSGQRLM